MTHEHQLVRWAGGIDCAGCLLRVEQPERWPDYRSATMASWLPGTMYASPVHPPGGIMGKVAGVVVLLFAALVAFIYLFGTPDVKGAGVDTGKAVDAAGQASTVVKDAGEPLWIWFFQQPWAYAAIAALGVTILIKRIIKGMSTAALVSAAVIVTAVFMLLAVGLAK